MRKASDLISILYAAILWVYSPSTTSVCGTSLATSASSSVSEPDSSTNASDATTKEIMQNKLLYNYLQEEKPLLYFLRQEFCSRKASYVCFMSVCGHFQQFLDYQIYWERKPGQVKSVVFSLSS